MAWFLFRLELEDGALADPSTATVAVPNWPVGSQMYFRGRTLRVIGRRDDDADQAPVLIVEDVAD
jgi:hypothetical protein